MCAPSINKAPNAPGYNPGPVPKTKSKDNKMWEQLQLHQQQMAAEKKLLEDIAGSKGPPALSIAQWTEEQKKKKLTFSDTQGRLLS